jgi:hypothetical protein
MSDAPAGLFRSVQYIWDEAHKVQYPAECGLQIVYVPGHADGVDHPDAEAGFITSAGEGQAWCRFWSKENPGQLRTRANSERCDLGSLVAKDTRIQTAVWAQLDAIWAESQKEAGDGSTD